MKYIAHIRYKNERDLSKKCYRWLQQNYEEQLIKNMELFIHKYGLWDDFIYLPLESKASNHCMELMCRQLTVDLENMKKGDAVSCLAKLIPSEKSKAYNHTGFNVGLAKMMELHCTNLRKTYLTPLRKYISEMEQPKSIENIFKTKQDYSFYEMMEILSNSQYDDICYIEKF